MTTDWDHILAHDEEILWQGRPSGRLRIPPGHLPKAIFGLVYALFAVVWISLALTIAADTTGGIGFLFPLFGLPFVLIGLWMMIGIPVWNAILRRNSFYTLTNRRGFIGSDLPVFGRHLFAEQIDPASISTAHHGGLTDVQFGWRRQAMGSATGDTTLPAGLRPASFEAVSDPQPLLEHLMRLKKQGTL